MNERHRGPSGPRIPAGQAHWDVLVVALVGILVTVVMAVWRPHGGTGDVVVVLTVWALLFGWLGLRRWIQVARTERTLQLLNAKLERKVADHRRAEEARKRGEAFYRTILEDIPEMIIRWRPDGTVTYVNDAYCRYHGRGRDEVMAQTVLPLLDKETLAGLAQDRPVSTVEYQMARPDGSVRWQRWVDRALFDESGGVREIQSIGADITERKETEARTARLLAENQALARQSLEIQEEERASLAQELHDELGQCLTAIRADAQIIRGRSADSDPVVHESAEAIDEVAGRVYNVVRRMMRRLRPVTLDQVGLAEALRETVDEWCTRHPELQCTLNIEGDLGRVRGTTAITGYRIVQEAMTNVAKHAAAQRVQIRVALEDETARPWLALRVEDDGRGMGAEPDGDAGIGLLGMRERTHAIGGRFRLESAPGGGVSIEAHLPLEVEEVSDGGGERDTRAVGG